MGYIADHAADLRTRAVLLVKVDFAAAVYWTTGQLTIYTPAPTLTRHAPEHAWVPVGLSVAGVDSNQGTVGGNAELRLGNADNGFSALLFGADPVGLAVTIWDAWLAPDGKTTMVEDSTPIFAGRIERPEMGEEDITFSLGPPVDLDRVYLPARRIQANCNLDYKGILCQSTSSDASCLRTFTDCNSATKLNTINFGGFSMFPGFS